MPVLPPGNRYLHPSATRSSLDDDDVPKSRPSIRRSAGDAPNQSRLAQSLSSAAETVSNTLRYERVARVLVYDCLGNQIALGIHGRDPSLKRYSTWASDGEQVAIPLGCGGVRRHGATQAMIVNELLEVSDELDTVKAVVVRKGSLVPLVSINHRPTELHKRHSVPVALSAFCAAAPIHSGEWAVRCPPVPFSPIKDDAHVTRVFKLSAQLLVAVQPSTGDDKQQHGGSMLAQSGHRERRCRAAVSGMRSAGQRTESMAAFGYRPHPRGQAAGWCRA